MSHPVFRLPEPVRRRLDARATRGQETPSSLAVRLIEEGLRAAEHPGVLFHDSPARGRAAALVGGPDVAEVIDVLTGLEVHGEQRVVETAAWFALHPSQIRVAMAYYTAFGDEIDRQIELRRREAEELRRRYQREQALLG